LYLGTILKRYFDNPFQVEGKWFKGNVHTHSINSDGSRTPEKLVEMYSKSGYDFISITDHSLVTDIKNLTNEELLLISGEEICIGKSHADTFYHIVGLGIENTLPFNDFDPETEPQKVINFINERGGISILAHPYWSGLNHFDMMAIKNYHGVEIYNTGCDFERNLGFSAPHIDGIILAGRRPYIYATDDHHGADKLLLPLDACIASINVKASDLTRKSILSSIQKGWFYSSTGPEIKNIEIDEDGEIKIECSPVKHISFVSTPSLGRRLESDNHPLTQASYAGRSGESYVRIEITDYQGKKAWSNPIYNMI
jgi:hypothetical protein